MVSHPPVGLEDTIVDSPIQHPLLLRAKSRVGNRDIARKFEEVGGASTRSGMFMAQDNLSVVSASDESDRRAYTTAAGVLLMGRKQKKSNGTCSLSNHVR